MIHHVSVEVSDLERSGRFYDAVLGAAGLAAPGRDRRADRLGHRQAGLLRLAAGAAAPGGGHVCFAANGIPAVKAAWEGGVAAGGTNDGEPGPRPEYGASYYSAYLRRSRRYRVEVAVGSD